MVNVPFSMRTSMSFISTSGTSALKINSFSVSLMSTGGTQGRPFGSANSRFTVSWKSAQTDGKGFKIGKGRIFDKRHIFLLIYIFLHCI